MASFRSGDENERQSTHTQRTARLNTERFPTELAAVWYAANYYYGASFNSDHEYTGVVFRVPGEVPSYGITVRSDGTFAHSWNRVSDVPSGTIPVAVWHTHLPADAGPGSADGKLLRWFLTGFDFGWDEFSGDDEKASDKESANRGYRLPWYLITDTVIKRYSGPGQYKNWPKAPPSHFKKGQQQSRPIKRFDKR
jgi:hypothetical protein